jgi:hypothetical protein
MLATGISDIITKEHWVQRGFANTDFDHQPKGHRIKKVILAMVANAYTESPGRRFGREIDYHRTFVTNATASNQRHNLCPRDRHDERAPCCRLQGLKVHRYGRLSMLSADGSASAALPMSDAEFENGLAARVDFHPNACEQERPLRADSLYNWGFEVSNFSRFMIAIFNLQSSCVQRCKRAWNRVTCRC